MTDDEISEILLPLMPLKDPYVFARAIAAAEREACAKIADDRATRCEEMTKLVDDADEVTHLRSLAWQFSVLAAEMRKRSNA